MEMRRTRWETLEGTEASRPVEGDDQTHEVDEDFVAHADTAASSRAEYSDSGEFRAPEGPDFGDETDEDAYDSRAAKAEGSDPVSLMQPFERLADLPPDFADAFEGFKLSILRHKSEGWQAISRDDVLGALDALKELAMQ
jgi:hypothetical protein